MAGWRPARVGEMVHREVAERLRQVKDPELTEISVTAVEMSKDLSRALVKYLPFGGGEPTKALNEALGRAGRQMRGPIGRALRLRIAPELVFQWDRNHEDAVRLTALLDQIGKELKPGGLAEVPAEDDDTTGEEPEASDDDTTDEDTEDDATGDDAADDGESGPEDGR